MSSMKFHWIVCNAIAACMVSATGCYANHESASAEPLVCGPQIDAPVRIQTELTESSCDAFPREVLLDTPTSITHADVVVWVPTNLGSCEVVTLHKGGCFEVVEWRCGQHAGIVEIDWSGGSPRGQVELARDGCAERFSIATID